MLPSRAFVRFAMIMLKAFYTKWQRRTYSFETYTPGKPLKIFFYGTNGFWNTGADGRTHEVIRQVNKVLGPANLDLIAAVFDKIPIHGIRIEDLQLRPADDLLQLPEEYLQPAKHYRPKNMALNNSMFAPIDQTHGLIIADGGQFMRIMNPFIYTLPTVLGMHRASEQKKFSLSYGVDAGKAQWPLDRLYSRYLTNSTIITRTPHIDALVQLGLNVKKGTDTGWTFNPLPPAYGKKVLSENGWDQKIQILAICPNQIDARPKGMSRNDEHVGFYREKAINSIANAVKAFQQDKPVYPIVISNTRGDFSFCSKLAVALGRVPHFTSGNYNMFELTSILRCADFLIASRYHAIVFSMPAGIPSGWIGPVRDPRCYPVFEDRGHLELTASMKEDLYFEERLLVMLRKLRSESEKIRDEIFKSVVRHLKKMADMGKELEAVVSDCYPEFPVSDNKKYWHDYLPPLGENLNNLLEQYSSKSLK
jgi:polysaccharide pyruvyl transferase WcaK-like protein